MNSSLVGWSRSLPVALLFALLASPASAYPYGEEVAVTPSAQYLPPGTPMVVDCTVLLIPSGEQTFVPGHTLVISTDLDYSEVAVQVYVDRRPAASLSGFGSVLFVNGYLLAYPSTRDVSIAVVVKGSIPEDARNSITVFRIEELDNSGSVIAPSVFTVEQFVSETGPGVTTTQPSPVETTGMPPVTAQTTAPLPSWTWFAGLTMAFGMLKVRNRGLNR